MRWQNVGVRDMIWVYPGGFDGWVCGEEDLFSRVVGVDVEALSGCRES